jgi:hypothetical protein
MVDMLFEGGNFVFEEDDIVLKENEVAQQMFFRVHTSLGSHSFYSDYGNPYLGIGDPISVSTHLRVADAFDYMVRQEDLIESAEIEILYSFGQINVRLKVNNDLEFGVEI